MIVTKPQTPQLLHSGDTSRSDRSNGNKRSTGNKNTYQNADPTTDVFLVDVPPEIFSSHPAAHGRGRWQGVFDIAVWLRTPLGVREPLQLLLAYWDDSDSHRLALDRCYPGSQRTVLLNGCFTLTATGEVRRAGLYLTAPSRPASIYLDEWHMVPQRRDSRSMR